MDRVPALDLVTFVVMSLGVDDSVILLFLTIRPLRVRVTVELAVLVELDSAVVDFGIVGLGVVGLGLSVLGMLVLTAPSLELSVSEVLD